MNPALFDQGRIQYWFVRVCPDYAPRRCDLVWASRDETPSGVVVTFWELMHWLADEGHEDMAVADLISIGFTTHAARVWATGRRRARTFEVRWT